MSLTLYHHGGATCAAKVRFCLAEKGLEWEGVYLDILKGDQFDPEYRKLNAKGVVPTLIHDDNVIVESTAVRRSRARGLWGHGHGGGRSRRAPRQPWYRPWSQV